MELETGCNELLVLGEGRVDYFTEAKVGYWYIEMFSPLYSRRLKGIIRYNQYRYRYGVIIRYRGNSGA